MINHVIWEDISHTFIEIPKSKDGKYTPVEYTGKLIFEELYEWMNEKKKSIKKTKEKSKVSLVKEEKRKGKKERRKRRRRRSR
jgi:hypothetical protein